MNKKFDLRTVLTVTTGRILTKPKNDNDNGISALYKILEYMTGEAPYTHALGRFVEECKPVLLKICPELSNANLAVLDAHLERDDGVNIWLEKCILEWGMPAMISIDKNIVNKHESKNPIAELGSILLKT